MGFRALKIAATAGELSVVASRATNRAHGYFWWLAAVCSRCATVYLYTSILSLQGPYEWYNILCIKNEEPEARHAGTKTASHVLTRTASKTIRRALCM